MRAAKEKRLLHAATAKLAAMVALIALVAVAGARSGIADEAMREVGMTTAPLSRVAMAELARDSAPVHGVRPLRRSHRF